MTDVVKKEYVYLKYLFVFNNFGCPIQLRYQHKFDHRSPLHSNRTGLRAINGFVIKFTSKSFIISCVWPAVGNWRRKLGVKQAQKCGEGLRMMDIFESLNQVILRYTLPWLMCSLVIQGYICGCFEFEFWNEQFCWFLTFSSLISFPRFSPLGFVVTSIAPSTPCFSGGGSGGVLVRTERLAFMSSRFRELQEACSAVFPLRSCPPWQ